MFVLKCFECGKTYDAKVNWQKYCSKLCADRASRERVKATRRTMEDPSKIREREMRKAMHLDTRPCHDCGKPTSDYRCLECRNKWRIRHGVFGHDAGIEEGWY